MFWILRKVLIPGAALAFGWFAQAEVMGDKCVDAGGQMAAGVCRGVSK